ncbi:hypothetical protein, partial [Neobacillus sp. LXY-1]|uniref:hypothetical protein n=1 Tax=Neobacillus sp. LXY-1 TaxID=3379133 RepID=UPI003EDFC0E0
FLLDALGRTPRGLIGDIFSFGCSWADAKRAYWRHLFFWMLLGGRQEGLLATSFLLDVLGRMPRGFIGDSFSKLIYEPLIMTAPSFFLPTGLYELLITTAPILFFTNRAL